MAVVQQLMQKEDDQEFTWHWHSIKDDNDDEGDVDPKPDAVQITDKWRWGRYLAIFIVGGWLQW